MSRATASPRRVGWQTGLLSGAFFGALGTAALVTLEREGWLLATITGTTAGAAFGALMGWFFHRWTRTLLATTGGADREQLRRAQLLLRRPDTHAEPATRDLAVRIAGHHLDRLQRGRFRMPRVAGVFVAFYLVVALVISPWWWCGVAMFSGLWVLAVLQVRSLRRSLAVLDDGAHGAHNSPELAG